MAAVPPWHAAFPVPRNATPDGLSPNQLLDLLQDSTSSGAYILVDLRRADHEGGTIRGSINLPAQSLHPTIPRLYSLFKAAGIKRVIWYCASSKGRGTRAAGWFSDYVQDHQDAEMESLVLLGGIKAWVAAGEKYAAFVDGYEPTKWGDRQQEG